MPARCWTSVNLFIGISLFVANFYSIEANAASVPGIRINGRILKPDGNPLEGLNTQFKIQIRSPDAGNCLYFEEVKVADLAGSNGMFALTVNDGIGLRTDTTGLSFERLFSNRSTLSVPSTNCSSGAGNYTPNASDIRNLVISFKDETMSNWETLPAQSVNYVPYAIESRQVGGFTAQNLLRVENPVTGPAVISPLTSANAAELFNVLAGSSSNYVKNNPEGVQIPPTIAAQPTVPAAGQQWYDSANGLMKYWDGTQVITLAPNSGIVSINTGAGLVGGPITSTGTISMAVLHSNDTTATKVTYDTLGRVIASTTLIESDIPTLSTAGKVSGTALNTGTIGGNTAVNTTGNIATSGTVSAGTVTTRDVRVYDSDNSNYIRFIAPAAATLSSDYSLVLPANAGSNGQFLGTDGTGNLSWMSALSNIALTSGSIFVGNGSNLAAEAVMSGDASLTNTGVITIANSAVNSAKIADGAIVNADINASAAIDASKIGSGDVSNAELSYINSVTSNVQTQIDGKVAKAGDSMTGNLVMMNQFGTSYRETTGNGTNAMTIRAPALLSQDYTLTLPNTTGNPNEVLATDGSGILAWVPALTNSLNSGNIFLGNASNIATSVAISGDASLSNTGVLTIANSAVNSAKIADGAIVNADINAAAAIDASKIGSGDVNNSELSYINSVTSNVQTQIDGKVAKAGDSMTGNLVMTNQFGTSYRETTGNGTNAMTIRAPALLSQDYTLTLPTTDGSANEVLSTDGNGLLAWIPALTNTLPNGTILVGNASNISTPVFMSGDASLTNAGVITIANSAVNSAKIADGAIVNADINAAAAIDASKIGSGDVSNAELSYINSVTSNVQTQIDGKVAKAGDSMTGNLVMMNQFGTSFRETTGNGTNAMTIRAAASLSQDYTLTLPNTAGNPNEVLSTDGVGVLAWVPALTNALNSGNIFLGNASNIATSVAISGDASLSNTGVITIANSAVNSAKIADGAIVNEDINAAAAIDASKIGSGDVSNAELSYINSVTSNVQTQIDGKVAKAGDSMTGNLVMTNQFGTSYRETTGNGTNSMTIRAPALLSQDYTLTLPNTTGNASEALITDGAGLLSWLPVLSSSLNNGNIFVGNASNIATSVTMSGDASLTNAGVITIANSAVNSAKIADGAIVNAHINAAAAIDASKIGSGDVSNAELSFINSVTSNVQTQIDGKVAKAGDSMTGNLVMMNQFGTSFRETTGNGTNAMTVRAAASLSQDYTLTLPNTTGNANEALATDGTGVLSWFPVLSNSLNNGNIFVGNASNIATSVIMSGDASITNAGVITIANSAVNSAKIADGAIVNADINAAAAIDASKIGSGDVSNAELSYINSVTSNVQTQIDDKVAKAGDSMTGNLVMTNQFGTSYRETTGNGTNAMTIRAPALLSQDYTLTLPNTTGNANEVLATDGGGLLSWVPALTNALNSGNIFLGNASSIATSVAISGDASLSNTGVMTITNSAVNSAKIADGAIVNADINAAAAIDATKIGSGDVSNTELSFIDGVTSNVQSQLDSKVAKAGDSMTGNLVMMNQFGTSFRETTGNGTSAMTIRAAASLSQDYTLTLPNTTGNANEVLATDGNGVLAWIPALINALPNGTMLVGNASNISTPVFMSGDASLTNAGVITIANSAVNSAKIADGAIVNADIDAAASIDASKIGSGDVSNAELSYINSVTSNVQTQIDGKVAKVGDSMTGNLVMTNQFGTSYRETTGNGTNAMTIRAPALLSQDYTLTLPTTDGNASEALITDGTGLLSWLPVLSNSLNSGNILVGNASNIATSVVMSGDAAISNSGIITIANSAVNSAKIADGTIVNADINASAAINATKIGSGDVSNSELSFLDGVTSNVQTQFGSKVSKAGDSMTGPLVMTDRFGTAFRESAINGTNTMTLRAPALLSQDYVLSLPDGLGNANEVLSTDGLGNLSWASALTNSLAMGNILVGNTSSIASSVVMSGDTTITWEGVVTIANGAITNAKVSATAAIDATKLGTGSVDNTELGYVNGVTSAIQTQLNTLTNDKVAKAGDTMTGNLSMNAQTGIIYKDADSSNGATLRSPANIATDYVLTLPIDDGAPGEMLSSNGSGVLSWVPGLTNGLASGNIFVGNASNVATAVTLSGDATLNNSGDLTINNAAITNAKLASGIDVTKLGSGDVTTAEFSFINSLTSNAQTQLNTLTSEKVAKAGDTMTGNLSFTGTADRTIAVDRNSVADTLGRNLVVTAGSATVGATDKVGGDLILSSGTATGTGSSNIHFQTATAGASGTADRAPATAVTITGAGNVGIGTTTPTEQLEVASGNTKFTNGQAYVAPQSSASASPLTFDTNSGNMMIWSTNSAAVTIDINNMKPGASYVLIIRGTGTGIPVINCWSGVGTGNISETALPPLNTRSGAASVYYILSDGNYCYINWTSGYP